MTKKVLVFDYDGTVVDSYEHYAKRFVALLGMYGLTGKVREFRSLYLSNFSQSLEQHGLTKQEILKLITDIRQPFKGRPQMIPPFTGMVALLNTLAKRYPVYIVTSNLTSVIEESLAYWKITGVQAVIGGDKELSKVKKLASIRKKHSRAELFYIGDTVGDMHEAKDAGCIAVGVAWGYHSARQLESEHPDFLVTKVSELGKLFAK